MGRNKKVGNIRCPYTDKSGKVCGKSGRFNSDITSWNRDQKFAKRTEYKQFMHNDGSKKHYIPMKLYNSVLFKDHPLKDILELTTDLGTSHKHLSISIKKLAENTIKRHYDKFDDSEKLEIQKAILSMKDLADKQMKFAKLTRIIYLDHILKGKKPPHNITNELEQIGKYFQNLDVIKMNWPFIKVIEKYDFPRRKEKWKASYEKQKNWPLDSKHIRKGIMG